MTNNPDLIIHFAMYGMSGHKRDVIDIITPLISANDRLSVFVCKALFDDHYPGEQKELHIIYTFNGILSEAKIKEHDTLSIPCFDKKRTEWWGGLKRVWARVIG